MKNETSETRPSEPTPVRSVSLKKMERRNGNLRRTIRSPISCTVCTISHTTLLRCCSMLVKAGKILPMRGQIAAQAGGGRTPQAVREIERAADQCCFHTTG